PKPIALARNELRSQSRQENGVGVAMYPIRCAGSRVPAQEGGIMNDAPHTGPDRVPPGQYTTEKWPVLSYGDMPRIDLAKWKFRISGLVAAERTFSWQEFQALPRVRITADFHCVTRFSTLDNGWEGVATRELLRHVQIDPEASHVLVHCYGGYTTNLPLEDFLSEHALLADRHNPKPPPLDHPP